MPGSAVRIQVEVRGEESDSRQIRRQIAEFSSLALGSDGDLEVAVLPAGTEHSDDCPLLVVGPEDEEMMIAAVEGGAVGYVLNSSSMDDIRMAIETVATGVAVIPPMMLGALLRHTVSRRQAVEEVERRLAVLTGREREVVEQLSRGKQRREIAQHLFISPETVRTHIHRAMSKLGIHSQNELMALVAPLDRGHQ
jgi:DNA-binding NarL/FixJ family response regulator